MYPSLPCEDADEEVHALSDHSLALHCVSIVPEAENVYVMLLPIICIKP